MPNPNYITTLKDDDKTNDLTPRTTIPAIYDSDLQYLNSNLKASDLNALQCGEVGKLESNFAQIEVSPSLHAYSAGSMLVYNGILYSVTSAISVGDLLVVGANLQSKSVADSLSDINTSKAPIFLGGSSSWDTDIHTTVGKWIIANNYFEGLFSLLIPQRHNLIGISAHSAESDKINVFFASMDGSYIAGCCVSKSTNAISLKKRIDW